MLSLKGGGNRGQSLEDKLYAMKYFISGQGLSFVVLKATTSEIMGPKRKHLNYLVTVTNEPNVSIPNLVKYLMQRASHSDWSIAFKSLITIHYLMSYGNERFIQNIASSTVNNRSFAQLSSFVDRTTSQAYDMSTFLRRYSRYINIKTQTYRSLGMDFCKIKPPSTNRLDQQQSPFRMRTMSLEQLMTTLPTLQNQFDTLVAFDASATDLTNGIITSAFVMLYKDFIKLYITYQTAIIRLLELYFNITQVKRAKELLDAYKKFLVRMNKVSDFMRVIDSVGMDKSDMPNLSGSPESSLKALEKHLQQLSENTSNKNRIYQPISSIELPTLQGDFDTLSRRKSRSSRAGTSPINSSSQQKSFNQLEPIIPKDKKRLRSENLDNLNEDSEYLRINDNRSVPSEKKKKDSYYYYCDLDPIQGQSALKAEIDASKDFTTSAKSGHSKVVKGNVYEDLSLLKDLTFTNPQQNKEEFEEDLMLINDDDCKFTNASNNIDNRQKSPEKLLVKTCDQSTNNLRASTPQDWIHVEL